MISEPEWHIGKTSESGHWDSFTNVPLTFARVTEWLGYQIRGWFTSVPVALDRPGLFKVVDL